jgi:hypothetical protein
MTHESLSKTNQPDGPSSSCCAKPASGKSESFHLFREIQQRIGNRAIGRQIQAKLKVSEPGDVHEQEADRIADQVMRTPPAGTVHAKAAAGNASRVAPSATLGNVASGGQKLPASVRAFFEPRFGHDFSHVRLHTDTQAAKSARDLQAHAFTLGSHILFQEGRFAPDTNSGQHLLAHELTHVIQQTATSSRETSSTPQLSHAPQAIIQRMTLGTGTPPVWSSGTLSVVPADDLERVKETIGLIKEVVDDPPGYDECHGFFTRRCPGGSATSMADTFARAKLWKLVDDEPGTLARADAPGTNIAYTQNGYDDGARGLAETLVHEMMHNCGIHGDDEHYLADVAGLYCIGKRNAFSLLAGPALGGDVSPIFLFSYRRFLTEWASGHIQPVIGGDINFTGLLAESVETEGLETTTGREFGSAIVGLHGRSNLLWGGERFGGLTARVETGFGVGRFRVRSPEPDEPGTSIEPGLVLQVGVGAEFYIPAGVHAVPVSIDAAYRLVQPLNSEAERIHAFVFGPSIKF